MIAQDHFRCWFGHLKLRAHFLDLGGLLFELGCESLYLFLLLRDLCFQLLNFANFAIYSMAGPVGVPGALRRKGTLRCTGAELPKALPEIQVLGQEENQK